jgi:hypothetical protein
VIIALSNGSGWSIDLLCKQVVSKYKLANKKKEYDLVVIWLDREKQTYTSDEMRSAIRQALIDGGADASKIAICIPDRMTENVILADEQEMRKLFGAEFIYEFEGRNGKSVLSSLYDAMGIKYRETYDGVRLLKGIVLRNCAAKSSSVKAFLNDLGAVTCWWVER